MLTKSRERSGGETRKEFTSVRPTLRRQQTSVPKAVTKVPKISLNLYKEHAGQMLVGTCSWVVKVRFIVLGFVTAVLAGVRAVVIV